VHDLAHGFLVVTQTVPEAVAQDNIGTLYTDVSDGGEAELVKAHRAGAPGRRPPGQGQECAWDKEMRGIPDRLAYDV
jgi:hypothetical protein